MNLTMKKKLAARKISHQFRLHDNNSALMFAIVRSAIFDIGMSDHLSGVRYLKSDMPHAELAHVDADWIRLVLNKVGISLEDDRLCQQ